MELGRDVRQQTSKGIGCFVCYFNAYSPGGVTHTATDGTCQLQLPICFGLGY